jgi:hypothetical protein
MTVNQKWYHQTVVIILAFIIFWPIGIYLIVSRSRASKRGMFVGGLDFKTACIVAAVLGVMGLLCLSGSNSSFGGAMLYFIGAVAVFIYGKKNDGKIERYKKYIDMVVNQHIDNIDTMANACGIPYGTCRGELATLIAKDVFKGASIDDTTHTLNLMRRVAPPVEVMGRATVTVTVTCSGCGATAAITQGTSCECEYCGNILNA